MSNVILEVRELTTKYITRFGEDVYAVDHVSLKVEEGKSLGIAGESGCGKSTLALSLMGYYFPPLHYTSGDIIIDGQNISGMPPDEVRGSILGKEIAYIPQAAMNALNPTRKIINFIEDVVRAHYPETTKKDIYDLAKERFAFLGLPAEVLQKYPVELSGGMKQRTVIAISVILGPKVLIADEPSKAAVFDPLHPYAKGLMGSIIVPEEGLRNVKLAAIPGVPPNLKKPPPGCRFAERCKYVRPECRSITVGLREVGKGRTYRCVMTESELREAYHNG